MNIEIRHRWNKEILFQIEAVNTKAALAEAVKQKKNLRGAYLRGAYLSGAYLSGAYLSGADLRGAYLSGADLSGADLSGADLSGADLGGAYLSGAYLRGAYLSGADLRGAYLSGAYLRGADLRGAYLSGAYLSGADLSGAYLSGAYLRGAYLSGADLRGADLSGADLSGVKSDFLSEVLKLPNELEFLRQALIDGKVDGSTYQGECACLAGTMARAKGLTNYNGGPISNGLTFKADSSSPRERFFIAIKKGDKPETNPACKIALEWTDEAILIRDNIRKTASPAP